ncbi:MAG TPA: hypothetical protein VGM97_14905 [Steroidobacteraceae bacterium]
MSKLIQSLSALWLAVVCATASAVSPADGSDAVLAVHSQPEGELRLQYTRDAAGEDAQMITLGLAQDYHYLRDVNGLRVYDYRLRRIYSAGPGNEFANDSLYAEVWFRTAEIESRVRLRKALQAGAISPDKAPSLQDPFWMESELGVTAPGLPRPVLQRSEADGRIRWLLDGAEVVAVRYDAEPVPPGIRAGLRRMWSTFAHIHPSIADDLTASGQIPNELWVTTMQPGKSSTVLHWKLTARHWESHARFPLSPHLIARPTTSAGAFPEIFKLLSKEIADRKLPPTQDAYVARTQSALDRGAGLEALLVLIEMNLAAGHPSGQCLPSDPRVYCTLSVKAGPLIKSDPRYMIAFGRQSPDVGDRGQFDTVPNAYVLRLLWATRPPGKGVVFEQTERDLLAALSASPVADFTKDTGDFYARAWQPMAAWQVWDLGRLLAGHTGDDLLHPIDSLEDQLYVGVPSLF